MSNIKTAFQNGKAFIAFITCGDPDLETTAAAVRAAAENGADLIELGIPFSDPTAEGPVIQGANLRALKGGITTDKIFEFVKELRKDVKIPMVFMTYANVVFSYGSERFIGTCRDIGIDGLILPDLPFEEKDEFQPICSRYGVDLISLVAPTSENRIAMIAKEAEGFIYIVSSLGVTGARSEIKTDLSSIVSVIRENTDVPCAIGFGISTPEQAKKMADLSDGAIVGSAIVKLLEKHGKAAPAYIGEYVRSMKNALRKKQNPVLDGLFADPDVAVFDGKYYIYPTSDGFADWSGTRFNVFSSDNGIDFKNEGTVLDVASESVPWAVGSAWAPCIAHKNGKYYFYFCAKEVNGVSAIGVAVSDTPTGPFVADDKPMITMDMMRANNIKMGQTIDPSIFCEGDKAYILFGNCEAAAAQLNDDMMSIDESTLRNIEGLKDFREAVTVFKRNGIYHFTWSCDDTGSENYHVNYGVSDSLFGNISFVGTILEKDTARDILGTGHHSITKLPDEDKYIIAYHRFATPLEKYPVGKGFNRETCLGKIDFDENGYIKKVEMTD